MNTIYGVPPQGHLQFQTFDNYTRVFSHLKGTHTYVFLYSICRVYVSYHTLFEGNYFVLPYSTQIWNAYVGGNLLKVKSRQNEARL